MNSPLTKNRGIVEESGDDDEFAVEEEFVAWRRIGGLSKNRVMMNSTLTKNCRVDEELGDGDTSGEVEKWNSADHAQEFHVYSEIPDIPEIRPIERKLWFCSTSESRKIQILMTKNI